MTTAQKSRVFLALGGNLGTPEQAFQAACRELDRHPRIALQAASSLYQTPAIGGPPGQPDYLNAVIELRTDLSPRELLAICQNLEAAAGRSRDVHWGARTLDLDLLFYDQQLLETAELNLPHPRLQERHFVLLPLVEVAAEFLHPRLDKTAAELLAALPAPVGIRRGKKEWIDND